MTSAIDAFLGVVPAARAHGDRAAVADGVHRVEQQRHEHLHELLAVRLRYARELRVELGLTVELLEAHVVLEQQQRALDDFVELDALLQRLLRPAEVEQAVDDLLAARHFVVDDLQILVRVGGNRAARPSSHLRA